MSIIKIFSGVSNLSSSKLCIFFFEINNLFKKKEIQFFFPKLLKKALPKEKKIALNSIDDSAVNSDHCNDHCDEC